MVFVATVNSSAVLDRVIDLGCQTYHKGDFYMLPGIR